MPPRKLIFLIASVLSTIGLIYLAVALKFYSRPDLYQSWKGGDLRDGWVENGDELLLTGLTSNGNHLALALDPRYRPTAPIIRIDVCGTERFYGEISGEQVIKIPLRGGCEPRSVQIHCDNPHEPGGEDTRKLALQVRSATVFSKIWLPILDANVWFPLFVLSAGFGLILAWLARGTLVLKAKVFIATMVAFSWLWFTLVPWEEQRAIYFFGGLLAVFLGILLGKRFQLTRERDLAECGRGAPPGSFQILFLVVLLAGTLLRFYGLRFGLPNNYHPDEVPKVNAVMRMVEAGDLNPRYFLHPSLLLYLTYGLNTLLFKLGLASMVLGTEDFRAGAFMAGRLVSASAGSATIIIVYLLGRRLFSAPAALLAAAILAFSPLHVTCSRYLKEDAVLVFFSVLSWHLTLHAVQDERRTKWLFLAAFTAGVSAATKYTGMLNVGAIVLAPWLKTGSWKPDWKLAGLLLAALPCAALGFFVCSPYAVLDFAKFSSDFDYEKRHMLRGHTGSIDAWSEWWSFHLRRSLLPGMTWITAGLGLTAVGFSIGRPRTAGLWMIWVFLLFFLPAEWVKAKPEPQPDRYILPCIPVLALLTGHFLVRWSQELSGGMVARYLGVIATIFAVFAPMFRSLHLASEVRTDTRQRMEAWILENVPRGKKVLLDWRNYGPFLESDGIHYEYIPRDDLARWLKVEFLRESPFDYLVVSSLFYSRYFNGRPENAPMRQIVRQLGDLEIAHEEIPRHGTYGFHNPRLILYKLHN